MIAESKMLAASKEFTSKIGENKNLSALSIVSKATSNASYTVKTQTGQTH